MNIRSFKNSDFKTIASWWDDHGEAGPLPGMMVEDGTFILEMNDIPMLSITVFLTQSKEIAYIEGFVKNPVFKEFDLEPAAQRLFNHAYGYASSKGYKRLVGYCSVEKLKQKYVRLGMSPGLSGMSSVVKELG